MTKMRSVIAKVVLISAFIAQLALASDAEVSSASYAEPLYLSLCGIILVAFGLLKGRKEE